MRSWLAMTAVLAWAGSAAACLNDVELPRHEREFRGQYLKPAATPTAPESPREVPLTALGLGLLTAAVVVSWTAGRARS